MVGEATQDKLVILPFAVSSPTWTSTESNASGKSFKVTGFTGSREAGITLITFEDGDKGMSPTEWVQKLRPVAIETKTDFGGELEATILIHASKERCAICASRTKSSP